MRCATSYAEILGVVVRLRRRHAGLTSGGFAERLGMSGSGWSRVETAETTMTVAQLYAAAQVLAVRPSELVAQADDCAARCVAAGVELYGAQHDCPPGVVHLKGDAILGAAALGRIDHEGGA